MLPRTMIESTLIVRSTSVMASAAEARHAVDERQDAHDARLDDAQAARGERHRGEERSAQGHEERAADAQVDAGDAERLDDEEEAHRLGRPDEAGEDDEDRHLAQRDGAEDALLEAVVELDDPVRQRAAAG